MKKALFFSIFVFTVSKGFCWGFYAHQRINYFAVFLLPPEMLTFYKPNIDFIREHSTDPDKRRYAVAGEAPKHFIDIDTYGHYPFAQLPRRFDSAVEKYSRQIIIANGIVPWWIQIMQAQLTTAFKERNAAKILKLSAEIGHYIADSHVPLHTNSNHDGQKTGQQGIHGFWESRIPELLAEKQFDFMIGKAAYVSNVPQYVWTRVLESAVEADTVLNEEAKLSARSGDGKYAFEERSGKLIRQYSTKYTTDFNNRLNGMVERKMRTAIASVAGLWYTAWVNAGQPDLKSLQKVTFSNEDLKEFEALSAAWKNGSVKGRTHE
jgi:hypothetical protein